MTYDMTRPVPGEGARSPVLRGECLYFLWGGGGFRECCQSCSLLKVTRMMKGRV